MSPVRRRKGLERPFGTGDCERIFPGAIAGAGRPAPAA